MSPDARRSVLSAYPDDCQPVGPVEALGNAGGFSGSRLWRYDAARGRLGLRRWPEESSLPARLGLIHAQLGLAKDLAFVPVPIPAQSGRTFVEAADGLWDLSPWRPGSADPARPPVVSRVRAAFSGLAAFHARFPVKYEPPSRGLKDRLGDVEAWMTWRYAAVRSRLSPAGSDPRSDLARVWIDRAERLSPRLRDQLGSGLQPIPVQCCLRDARADHFLFEGDRLTGLVDFGAMGFDTVALDLARLLGDMVPPDRPGRAEALAAYRAVRPISDRELRLVPMFEAANAVLGAGRWVLWHFLEGRIFEDPEAVARGIRRSLDRIDENDRAGWFRS